MKTSSLKAKGRSLQQKVRATLAVLGAQFGLEDGDFVSTPMGVNGPDIQLSPAAKKLMGDLCIECKSVQKIDVFGTYLEHKIKHPHSVNILVTKKDYSDTLVTIDIDLFAELLYAALVLKNEKDSKVV